MKIFRRNEEDLSQSTQDDLSKFIDFIDLNFHAYFQKVPVQTNWKSYLSNFLRWTLLGKNDIGIYLSYSIESFSILNSSIKKVVRKWDNQQIIQINLTRRYDYILNRTRWYVFENINIGSDIYFILWKAKNFRSDLILLRVWKDDDMKHVLRRRRHRKLFLYKIWITHQSSYNYQIQEEILIQQILIWKEKY